MCKKCTHEGGAAEGYAWTEEMLKEVQRDIRKCRLTPEELSRIEGVMGMFVTGGLGVRDHDELPGRTIEELRISGDHRIIRVYFGRDDGALELLAVHVQIKKKNRDNTALNLAEKRWKAYQ